MSATPVIEWTRQLGYSAYEQPTRIAFDSFGNVYTTGYTEGSLGGTNAGDFDAWLSKHDSSGNLLWTRQIGTSAYDDSYGVAVDSFGNVYITGETDGSLGGTNAGSGDAFVAKYTSRGTQLWTQQFGTADYNYSYDIAVDSFNNIYVAGETEGSLGATNAGDYDAWIFAKFNVDSAGNTLGTASNLGTLSDSRTFSDFIDAVDTDDYYQFSLNTSSNFNLLLSGLRTDADVQLLDSSGVTIASSTNSFNDDESINTMLSAGTYYIHLYGADEGNTTYTLNLTV